MGGEQFTVLVGSYGRGAGEADSDIDIVRIGHTRPFKKSRLGKLAHPKAPISYIDYDPESFARLYESGSLFVHHILTEGQLLDGDRRRWTELVENFAVTEDLSSEITEQLDLCRRLARPEAFTNATMPLLSHLFRALKNAAIFSLAARGVYVYDKREALRQWWTFLTNRDIELLVTANNLYVRGTPQSQFIGSSEATKSLSNLCSRVNRAVGELRKNGNETSPQRNSKSNKKSRTVRLGRRKE
jgi:predicted nucleotidyltransferase